LTSPTPAQLPAVAVLKGHIVYTVYRLHLLLQISLYARI
jgi:hypothetical protein